MQPNLKLSSMIIICTIKYKLWLVGYKLQPCQVDSEEVEKFSNKKVP